MLIDVDDGSEITTALNTAMAEHRRIEIPPGTYTIGGVIIPSGTEIVGARGDVNDLPTKLVRRANAPIMASAEVNAEDIAIRDLSFDMAVSGNYQTALFLSDTKRVTVEGCHFRTDTVPGGAPTLHGILAKRVHGLRVRRNSLYQTQVKTNELTDARIEDNVCVDSHNFGISCVTLGGSEALEDVYIGGNHVRGGYAGGIFVGTDGDLTAGGVMRRVRIADNTIETGFNDQQIQTVGLIVRTGAYAESLHISDNVIAGDDVTNAVGLYLKSSFEPGESKDVRLIGNRVSEIHGWAFLVDQWAAWLSLFDNSAPSHRLTARGAVTARQAGNGPGAWKWRTAGAGTVSVIGCAG